MSRAPSDKPTDRVVVVTRKTELEELTARFSTVGQSRFYLRHAGRAFDPIQQAHDTYHRALDLVMDSIPDGLKRIKIDRSLVPQYDFDADIVIALGQDGLVSNTAKYLPRQPLIGVNPDPSLYDGVLLPWSVETVAKALNSTLAGQAHMQPVVMAEAQTQDGRKLLAFNDLFIGARTHVSARYALSFGGQDERQSSSGVIVSTGAGSTGWLRSIRVGAAAIAASVSDGAALAAPPTGFDRGAEQLVFSVREPFPSKTTGTSLVYGTITRDQPLVLSSRMSQGGAIFSDGMEMDFIDFNSGTDVTVRIAEQKAYLVTPR